MTVYEVVHRVLDVLEADERPLDYIMVGAMAVARWGFPRSTSDADFVLAAPEAVVDEMLSRLPGEFQVEEQARMELFTGTMRWVVDVKGTAFKVEVFLQGNDPHHQAEFARRCRQRIPVLNREAWIPTAEDLIIQKLRWARPKDIQDIDAILRVQSSTLDFPYIEKWCDQHGTRALLEELRRSIPPDL